MPALDLLLPFAIASVLFAIMPGPALLYTAAQTMAHGKKGGLLAVLGIHVGGLAHVIAAAAGLSAVFKLVPEAYVVVKVLGALYLVWMGIGLIRQKVANTPADMTGVPVARSAKRAFFQSVTVEVLNPKTALFFLAFLPQFVDPAATFPIWLQLLILGFVVNLAFSSADLFTVFVTSAVMRTLRQSQRAQRALRYLGGSILVGLGAHLAISRT